jgi:hypothetical protein
VREREQRERLLLLRMLNEKLMIRGEESEGLERGFLKELTPLCLISSNEILVKYF